MNKKTSTQIFKEIIKCKNKKCKTITFNVESVLKKYKLQRKNLSIVNLSDKAKKIFSANVDIYPYKTIIENGTYLQSVADVLTEKINANITEFRAYKNIPLIQFVAKDCAKRILQTDNVNIVRYVQEEYGYNNLYKKEILILPALIIAYLINALILLCNNVRDIEADIKIGASLKTIKCSSINNAMAYGIAKYNVNLLKLSENCDINFKKCTFNLIAKLNVINKKFKIIIAYIGYLDKTYKVC